jgi:hypothetical protein
VERKDSHIKAFVKREKINFTAKPDPAPRVIQPRDPRYNIEVGRYLKQLEKRIYQAINDMFGYEVVAKGKNGEETARMMFDHMRRFADAVGVGGDASRFDQHCSVQALQWEHACYLRCFHPSERPALKRLLDWQLSCVGKGYTKDGRISFKNRGGRKSGDMNTSMGNVLLMCCMIHSYLRAHGLLDRVRVLNNGDDFVLFCDRKTARIFSRPRSAIGPYFLLMGYRLTMEAPERELEGVEFCQAKPVFDGEVWTMARNPRTCLDKDSICLAPVTNKKQLDAWRQSVAQCGTALSGGLPVLSEFYHRMRCTSRHKRTEDTVRRSGMFMLAAGMTRVHSEPSTASRVSFFKAFNLTPDEQRELESHFRTMPPSVFEPDGPDADGEHVLSTLCR